MWNGSVWANTGPAPGFSQSELHGVSCSSSTSCFTVSRKLTPTNQYVPLIERWNGTKWLPVPRPNVGGNYLERLVPASFDELLRRRQRLDEWHVIERWSRAPVGVVVVNPTGSADGGVFLFERHVDCFDGRGAGSLMGGGTLPARDEVGAGSAGRRSGELPTPPPCGEHDEPVRRCVLFERYELHSSRRLRGQRTPPSD